MIYCFRVLSVLLWTDLTTVKYPEACFLIPLQLINVHGRFV